MKVRIPIQGGELSVDIAASEFKMPRTKWMDKYVKLHENMGADKETLAKYLGDTYDLIVPPKKKEATAKE